MPTCTGFLATPVVTIAQCFAPNTIAAQGFRLRIVHEEKGLFTTTGRALQRGAAACQDAFIVVTEESETAGA
jgi:hypothetical protein